MLVGRKQEMETLRKFYESNEAEFLVVYGRRRVGKTFLVRQYFKDRFFFYATGIAPEDSDKTRLQVNLERSSRDPATHCVARICVRAALLQACRSNQAGARHSGHCN
jgi:hypothetical protein